MVVLFLRVIRQPSPVPPREEPSDAREPGFKFSRVWGLTGLWSASLIGGFLLLLRR